VEFKVVDVVVEHDVDTAGGNVLLDSLAVFVGIGRVKKQGVRDLGSYSRGV
jgi:hypothetical protein